jgi:aspartyl/asparaginyl beta-hydroxylase (cupin superfamily)
MTTATIDAIADLKTAADRAMARADPRVARDLFERAVALAPGRLDILIGLAACRRALGEAEASLGAVEAALAVDPRFFPALLMRGSLLESMGRTKQAAKAYGTALLLAPARESVSEATGRAIDRARQVHERHVAELAAALKEEAGLGGGAPASAEGRRADTFIEAIVGRRKIFHQEPVQFHYPGLAGIEFHERDEFPWLEAFETYTDDIRTEVLSVWGEGSPDLAPYVNYPAGVPLDQWAELNRSLSWSAFHLLLDGAPVEANCRRCPATMAALALVDQPNVQGRSPAAMYSILRPRTRIPPHTGVSNTRLVVHLPLIVPEGCGFRVGGETRPWRVGEAWVFDDTIEHEAWNDSDQPRAVLICDVWNPRLSRSERELVARVSAALDRFNSEPASDAGA